MLSLRHKFGFLALLYAVALAANVALCCWCVLLYYQSFMGQAAAEPLSLSEPAASSNAGSGDRLWQPVMVFFGENYTARILAVNAICGVGLGVLGLRLVRRWVLVPVAGLRQATLELGRGNLEFRTKPASRDELGELAGEVNSMAASIVRMQGQLVEQERRQVAAQALRCIVHNIRSPLTGVRWLAEAVSMRNDVDPDTAREQNLIMQAVDEIMSWLQGFRSSLEQACQDSPRAQDEGSTEPRQAEAFSTEEALVHGQHSDR